MKENTNESTARISANGQALKAHSIFSPTNQDSAWNFINKILNLALPLLKPHTGKFYTHCNGKSVPSVLHKYQDMLDKIVIKKNGQNYSLKWVQRQSFVPSFMEVWIFYQVQLVEMET